MMAERIWVLCIAILRLLRVSWWYSWVPWEKLNRATFMPALRSFSSMGTVRDAGPKVQTILVFGIRPSFGSSFIIPSMSMFAISLWFQIRSDQIAKDFHKLVWEKLRRNRGLLLTFSAQLSSCGACLLFLFLLLLLYLLSLAPPNCFPFYQMSLSFTLIIIKLYCCVVLNCGQSLNMWMMEKVCLV